MRLPQPTYAKYSSLLNDISRGQIKIPQFQRDFVWTVQKSASLIDSVIKGYPVGTFIFWVTRERLRHLREIGGQILPPPKQGETASYVLDGQQRITSLYAAFKGLKVERESGYYDDFRQIYIDLEAEEGDQIVITDVSQKSHQQFIALNDLIEGGLTVLAAFDKKYHKRLEDYRSRIDSYDFPIVEVRDVALDVATEIFTRINVGGTPLTLFEIMVAKTYDEERNFDLQVLFDEFKERLQPLNYETISDAAVLQLISLVIANDCKKQTILKIQKDTFIDTWPSAIDAIERAIDFFRSSYGIAVSALLPYNSLLVPFGYFFYRHRDQPNAEQRRFLEDFFWRVSLGGRYSSALESKLAQDVKRIDSILEGTSPDYDWGINTDPDFILQNGWFNTGRSFIKAILCIFAFIGPRSFKDNGSVNITNNWLKQANSKNYHHFFPKSYLLQKREENWRINNIVNITIVDDYLNKRDIGARPPSRYMKKFAAENRYINASMKSHLIDMKTFDEWANNYDHFLELRSKMISREILKRVIRRDIDLDRQDLVSDDYEQEASSAS